MLRAGRCEAERGTRVARERTQEQLGDVAEWSARESRRARAHRAEQLLPVGALAMSALVEILKYAAKRFAVPALLCAAEKMLLPKYAPALLAPSTVMGLPKAFGLVCLINVVGSGLFTVVLGFKVGSARSKFVDKAQKDGDEDAEARFSYPKMYAEGFSEHARNFNCVQRAHQHTLETYPQILAMSLVGGIGQPVTTALGGALWIYARHKWAGGYATGDPKNRYEQSDGWGRHIWTALLMLTVAASSTGLQCLGAF